jgi:hypothetical protein
MIGIKLSIENLIEVSFLKSSNKEIKKMNIGKIADFQYSDSYVQFLAFLKIDASTDFDNCSMLFDKWYSRVFDKP